MKTIGIILIFLSVFSFGIFFYIKNISVLKSIKRAEEFLGVILLGIKSERMTVSEILLNAEENSDYITKRFLKSIEPKSLNNAVKTAEECGFSRSKKVSEILDSAFSVLGKYSYDDQIKEIGFCREKLLKLYENAEENLKTKAKLAAYSGFFGGILAIIMFI